MVMMPPIYTITAAEVEFIHVFTHPGVPFAKLGVVAAVLVVALLILTALQHRRHAGSTEQRMCRSCALPHPPFARFCRRCGRALAGKDN
jgi:hypothetical protein